MCEHMPNSVMCTGLTQWNRSINVLSMQTQLFLLSHNLDIKPAETPPRVLNNGNNILMHELVEEHLASSPAQHEQHDLLCQKRSQPAWVELRAFTLTNLLSVCNVG